MNYKLVAAFFALTLAFYSIGLGGVALLDPDEPVYAQTAREMTETGSWLTPRLNGLLWFDKPPMYFWLSAVSFKVFSVSEFAARFPSAFMASLLVALVYAWALRAFGDKKTAVYSALTLASSLLFVFIARAAVTDMTLCFFMNLSFFMIYLALGEPEKKFKYINLFYFFSGFSVLTKGPVGLVLPLLVIVPFLVLRRDWLFLRSLYSPSGFLLFGLSALPWYIAMLMLHGSQFFNTFIGYHNLIRFLEPEHVRTSSVFFYAPVLLLGFFPHLAPAGALIKDFILRAFSRDFYARYLFGNNDRLENGGKIVALSFLLFIAAGVFGFFSIAKTKLVTYILPMFPAFAMFCGYYYKKLAESGRVNIAGASLSVIISGALFYGFRFAAPSKLPAVDATAFYIPAFVCALIAAVNIYYGFFARRSGLVYANCFLMAVFLVALNVRLLPEFSDMYSSRAICGLIKKELKPGEKLGYFSKTPSALFYSDVPITHVNESASSRMGTHDQPPAKVSDANGASEISKKDGFVRKISPITVEEAFKYLDKFRKLRNFLSHNEKVYVIMLNSDYQKYSQEIKLNHKYGGIAGKYTYITNK